MRLVPFVSILILWAALESRPESGSVGPVDGIAQTVGQAFALDAGTHAYSEEHEERYAGGRLQHMKTRYRDGKGAVMAERTLDFSASSTRPDYHLRDLRSGYEEGASVEQGNVKVFTRAAKGAERKEKILKVPEPYVIDGGFHPFLKEHWDQLTQGKRIGFHFVVPSRRDFFRFVAYSDPEHVPKGGNDRIWVAVPESRMLRMLVEPIVATYDSQSRRMREYRGLSNIEGPDGKSQKVRLVYREPGL